MLRKHITPGLRHQLTLLLMCLALSIPNSSLALSLTSGTYGIFTLRDCTTAPVDCTAFVSPIERSEIGGSGAQNLSDSLSNPSWGSTGGSISFMNSAFGADVSGGTSSTNVGRNGTSFVSIQAFEHTGIAPTLLTYNGDLSYSKSEGGSPTASEDGAGILNARLGLFTSSTNTFEIDDLLANSGRTGSGIFVELANIAEGTGLTDITSIETFDFDTANAANGALLSQSVQLAVNPGDTIFSLVLFQTIGNQGGFVDALSTFNTGFEDTSKLSLTTVPIPAAAWLFGSALLGLATLKRKST